MAHLQRFGVRGHIQVFISESCAAIHFGSIVP